jgi:hypothetical protein
LPQNFVWTYLGCLVRLPQKFVRFATATGIARYIEIRGANLGRMAQREGDGKDGAGQGGAACERFVLLHDEPEKIKKKWLCAVFSGGGRCAGLRPASGT